MVVVTGDTHGNFQRLYSRKYKSLNNGDYVLICGDFGGVWHDCERQDAVLDSLDNLPFTVLFADGNHENYDLLNQFPVQQWNGGQVHVIRPNVLHLMRGNVFEIEQKSFFVMGGAASHDLWNGVYDPEHPDHEKYDALYRDGEFFRIKGLSWWEQELPTDEEINQAWDALCAHEKKIDYRGRERHKLRIVRGRRIERACGGEGRACRPFFVWRGHFRASHTLSCRGDGAAG